MKAGLVETLQGDGPFTVFAPTNDAFDKLDAATLKAVQSDDALLKKVLLYHVLASQVLSTDLAVGETEVKSANGLTLYVTKTAAGAVIVLNNQKVFYAKVVILESRSLYLTLLPVPTICLR